MEEKCIKYLKYKKIFNELLETIINIANCEEYEYTYGFWFLAQNYHVCKYDDTKKIAIDLDKKINDIINKFIPDEYEELNEECNKYFDFQEKKTDILYKALQEIIDAEDYNLREGFEYPYHVCDYDKTKKIAIGVLKQLKEFELFN